jgi:Holliday junction resolvase RusA-like endonuclease
MIQEITFFVEGLPRAKQSFRSLGRRGGYQPAYIKAWQNDVGYAGQLRMRALRLYEPLTGPLTVELTFFLPDARRIDLDNLSKAVQDGLNGVVWEDDQHNIRLVLEKYICRQRQGVLVNVTSCDRDLEISLPVMENVLYLRGARSQAVIGATL